MKYKSWTEHISSVEKKIDEEFKIIKRPLGGSCFDYMLSQCKLDYKSRQIIIEQVFTKSDYENGTPGSIQFIYEYKNRNDFQLSISERDFFDKLFSNKRFTVKNPVFDKKFTIQSNDHITASKIFADEAIQSIFLNNRFIILNISSKESLTKIVLKNISNKLYDFKEYELMLNTLKLIIDSCRG